MSDAAGTILIIDDDPGILAPLREVLESEGLTVVTAETGPAALALAARERPDLIILDLNLPDFRGEIVGATLNDRFRGEIPLVIISADPCAQARSSGLKASVLLRKPLNVEDLVVVVQALLNRRPPK